MKKIISLILALTLCLSAFSGMTFSAVAVSHSELNSSGMFLKQQENDTCTLASAAMLLRRSARLLKITDWDKINEAKIKSTAWVEAGLKWSFSYKGVTVSHASLPGGTKNAEKLKELLAKCPEGIVVYNSNQPHAVLMTDESGGVFYVADPANCVPAGRIPIEQCYLTGSGQNKKIEKLTHYWYVTSPSIPKTTSDNLKPEMNVSKTLLDFGEKVTVSWKDIVENPVSTVLSVRFNGRSVAVKDVTGITACTLDIQQEAGVYEILVTATNEAGEYKTMTKKVTVGYVTAKVSKSYILPDGAVDITWNKVTGATSYEANIWHKGVLFKRLSTTDTYIKGIKLSDLGAYDIYVTAIKIPYTVTSSPTKVTVHNHKGEYKSVKPATFKKNGSTGALTCKYCGEKIGDAKVITKLTSAKLSATVYGYNGKAKKPSVKVLNANGTLLKAGTDYKVTYEKGRKKVGTYGVTVTFKGYYSGKKVLKFKVNPKKPTIKKTKAKWQSLTVSWKRDSSSADGYIIEYSTSKSFKKYMKITYPSNRVTSATLWNLKTGKKYYVRVRSYKTANGKKYYSERSAVKSKTAK